MNDLLGQALFEYHLQLKKQKLWIHNRYGKKEEMPVSIYFRAEEDMPELELQALEECRGKILDIGAGAGSHSLILQQRHFDITAIDQSSGAIKVMEARGVQSTLHNDIFLYNGNKFDTLLMLMNGIGLAGTMAGLNKLLLHLKTLLSPGGQIIFDSSDIAYLYNGKTLPDQPYYGEVWYMYKYKKQFSEWFKWLYADKRIMRKAAKDVGFKISILTEDKFGQYLALLTL